MFDSLRRMAKGAWSHQLPAWQHAGWIFLILQGCQQHVLAPRGGGMWVGGVWALGTQSLGLNLPPDLIDQMALNRLICLLIHSINIFQIQVKHCSRGRGQVGERLHSSGGDGKEQWDSHKIV